MATAEPPTCSICEHPMKLLPLKTSKKELAVFACDSGKVADKRIPCDGDAYRFATKADASDE